MGDMSGVKTEATGWLIWVMWAIVLLVLLGAGMRFFNTAVDRQVMVTSHQYKEGMAERAAILEANLEEVEAQLAYERDETVRNGLNAQRAALSAQLKAARR